MGSAVVYSAYSANELGTMLIDIVGALFNGLAMNAGTIAVLIVVSIVALLAVDALTGVFGVFKVIKR